MSGKRNINNLAMKNVCGKVGYRTRKNRHLEATSRSIIIEGTKLHTERAVRWRLSGLQTGYYEDKRGEDSLQQISGAYCR